MYFPAFQRFTLVAAVSTFLFLSGTATAQKSHLESLIDAYKQQNPQGGASPNAYTPNAGPYVPPQQQQGPVGGLKDPLARPGDLINQPMVASRPEIVQAGYNGRDPYAMQNAPPLGNPRDPLNIVFSPESNTIPGLPPTPYDEMGFDARLNDVFFLNPQRGWAVGDRGMVWGTLDGGKTWTKQLTPIDCPLLSVHFVNETFGIAVGGFQFPFSKQGRGVVLMTVDGGHRWTLQQTANLPVITKVRMLDPMKGWVAGEASELYPTGIFRTKDGGKQWTPTSGGKSEGWASIDFYDEQSGAGIGTRGTVQILRGAPQLSQTPHFGACRMNGMKLDSKPEATTGWMVGDKGLILSTTDRGLRWTVAPGPLPGNAAAIVDLNTVETCGPNIWVAGSPGTFVYSSADQGKTWKGTATGSAVPIRKIQFIAPKNGFAVGDLGTILATNDGGASWVVQRNGGTRLALLGMFGRPDDIPFEVFVRLCADQGYLGGAMLLFRDPLKQNEETESTHSARVHEAMLRTGASGSWELGMFALDRFEMRTPVEKIIERLQKENDGKGLQLLRERLVASIRQWKPDVVFAPGFESGREKDFVKEFVLREIIEAVKQAEDPKAYPYQQTELGLAPWKVKKIHLTLGEGTFGDVNMQAMDGSIRLGQSYDELAYISRCLVEDRFKERSPILGFSTARDDCPPTGNRDFFAGLDIRPGSEARRALAGSYEARWNEVQARIQHRRQSLGIIQNIAMNAQKGSQQAANTRLAATASELLRKIDQDAAVRALLDMGRQFTESGDWDSAAEAFNIVVEQYSQHPLAREAFLWLIRYYVSAETAWRIQQMNVSSLGSVASTRRGNIGSVQTINPSNKQEEQLRRDRATSMSRFLDQAIPDVGNDPRIRFAMASMKIRNGWGSDAVRYFQSRGKQEYDDVWGMRARAEFWLNTEDKLSLPPEMKESPLPTIRCEFTSTKPYLDGQFDKEFDHGTWFESKLYSLTPEKPRRRLAEILQKGPDAPKTRGMLREENSLAESKNFGTQAMFLYDKEYLFVGVRCKRAPGFSYPPVAEKPRARDTNLDDQDRVEILLDIDRDYGTYYTLTVDSRGWVVDACCGDKNWNPSWYVARSEDKDYWYFEAAIPLESLTNLPPLPKTVWGVGIRRIVPGSGIECWNAENSFNLQEGLGFLVFE